MKETKRSSGQNTRQPEEKQPQKRGRPVTYTASHELKLDICKRIANGEPLRQICRSEGFPSWQRVYQWIEEDEAFGKAIARARDLGYDAIAEDLMEVAHGRGDSSGDVQRDKLVVETKLKLLAKWNPKKYGETGGLTVNIDKQQVMVVMPGQQPQLPAPAIDAEYVEIGSGE